MEVGSIVGGTSLGEYELEKTSDMILRGLGFVGLYDWLFDNNHNNHSCHKYTIIVWLEFLLLFDLSWLIVWW